MSDPRGGGARSLRPRGRPGDKSSPQRWAPPGTPWTSLSGVCPESYWGPVQGGLGCLEKAPWPQRLFSLSWMILPEHFCATGHLRMGGGAERRAGRTEKTTHWLVMQAGPGVGSPWSPQEGQLRKKEVEIRPSGPLNGNCWTGSHANLGGRFRPAITVAKGKEAHVAAPGSVPRDVGGGEPGSAVRGVGIQEK